MVDQQTRRYLQAAKSEAADWSYIRRIELRNRDGSDGQQHVRHCKLLDRLKLASAGTSRNPSRIAVLNRKGQQLGYLDTRCAIETRKVLRAGGKLEALVADTWQDPSGAYGLVIGIFRLKPGFESLDEALGRFAPQSAAPPQRLLSKIFGRSRSNDDVSALRA